MTAKPNQAVVFFDFDGTIARKHSKPTPEVVAGVEALRKNGHLAVLCTGRSRRGVGDAPQWDGVICSSGAYVEFGGELLQETLVPLEHMLEMAEIFTAAQASITLESSAGSIMLIPPGCTPVHMMPAPQVTSAAQLLEQHPTFRCNKFCMQQAEYHRLAPSVERLRELFNIQDTNMGFVEFAMHGVSKGDGISRLLKHLGRSTAGTYGIGDSENDLEMLDLVETAIAMGNAQEHVKAHADYVTASVEENGACRALQHFGLI